MEFRLSVAGMAEEHLGMPDLPKALGLMLEFPPWSKISSMCFELAREKFPARAQALLQNQFAQQLFKTIDMLSSSPNGLAEFPLELCLFPTLI